MSQIATGVVSPTRSRLAQIIGLPTSPEPSTSRSPPPNDEWYIPYNGPIEPPRRPRGNTFGGAAMDAEEQAFRGRARAASNATRKSYASSGGIGEAPVHSASLYDRSSSEWERERDQRGSIASFLTFGQSSRKSLQRPAVSVNTAYPSSALLPGASRKALSPGSPHALSPGSVHRSDESHASVFAFPHQARGRHSEESAQVSFQPQKMQTRGREAPAGQGWHDEGEARRSDDSAQVTFQPRRAQTRGQGWYDDEAELNVSRMLSPGSSHPPSTDRSEESHASASALPHQPRGRRSEDNPQVTFQARNVQARGQAWYEDEAERTQATGQPRGQGRHDASAPPHALHTRLRTLAHSVSQPVLSPSDAQRPHPYAAAVAFPSAPQRKAPPTMHLHAHTKHTVHTTVRATADVSPAAIAAALDAHAPKRERTDSSGLRPPGGSLRRVKSSLSTPNLRALFGGGSSGEKGERNAPAKTQYAAETWCDALMFPRPRFRAHVISPPASPTDVTVEGRDGRGWVMPRDEKPGLRRAATVNAQPSPRAQTPPPLPPQSASPRQQDYLAPAPPHTPPRQQDYLAPASSHTPPRQHDYLAVGPPQTPPRQGPDYLSTDPRAHRRQQHTPPRLPPIPVSPALAPEILTPTEETLRRVIAAGEQRDEEREKWNELARTSFQNRRSRSLSRTRPRKKSGAAAGERVVRIRVESDAGAVRIRTSEETRVRVSEERAQRDGGKGLGRSLSVGLTTLAAEAFRQPTPTISTASASHSGGSDSNAHSRNTSASLPQGPAPGHARNTSWSKVALKKLCAPEPDVFSDAAVSPEEEKLEGALAHEKTTRLRVHGRREEAEEADVQFLDIGPQPAGNHQRKIAAARARTEAEERSHSQNSNTSDSLNVPAVGIALSTPPGPSPVEHDLPDLSAHPYAQPAAPRLRAGPVPVSAAYAGPHPTSLEYNNYNKHRLPPHVQQLEVKPPEKRMYAALRSGAVRQVSTPEITQSPPWDETRSPGAYAYANPNPNAGSQGGAYAYANVDANDKRESTLGVEEVLMSRAFQRGGGGGSAEDSGFGSLDDHEMQHHVPARKPSPPSAVAALKSRARKPVPHLNAYSGIPSLSHTVTTAAHTEVTEPDLVQHVVRDPSTALSSPSSQGSGSSRTSPRPLGSMDDLEPFRDLFYKPGGSVHQRTPSSELRSRLGARDASEERIKPSDGLRDLARQPSDESSGYPFPPEHGLGEGDHQTHVYGQRLDGLEEERTEGHSPMLLPGLNDESIQLGSPLRAEFEQFPEDIESSRASSVIEHDSVEETLRLGTVSMAVAEPTQSELRQSTALSFGDTEVGGSLQDRDTIFTTTSSHGIPATLEDLLRTSFVTTTSSTSHMTNLIGDFPTPPVAEGVTPPPAALLNSYFNPPAPTRRASRRRHLPADASGAQDEVSE